MHALLTPILAAEGGGGFTDVTVDAWMWVALLAFIGALLTFDLLVVHRRPHAVHFKEAAIESAVWISIGVAFTGVVYLLFQGQGEGSQAAGEYISGFLIEKSLSIDNVFVWAVIFSYFAIPDEFQFRTLFWGIFGALVLRAIFIFAGIGLIETFTFTLAIFGLILLYSAWKIAFHDDENRVDPEKSIVLRAVRKVIPSTTEFNGQHLFTKENGKRLATPLFAVLILIESTDVVFAVDSVPAILAISREQFIVFSSNAFAILGLRALYFCVNGLQDRFVFLNYGLGAILAFVGAKMMITFTAEQFGFPSDDFHFPTFLSLAVIIVILTATIILSLRADKRRRLAGAPAADEKEPENTPTGSD